MIMRLPPRDPEFYRMENGSEQRSLPEINYDYLCVTTEDLLRTHRIEAVIPMPECTATEANYYVREGSYFTSYDQEQMQAVPLSLSDISTKLPEGRAHTGA